MLEKFLKFIIKIYPKNASKFEVKNQKINRIDHLSILAKGILAKTEASISLDSFVINELFKFIIFSANIIFFMFVLCNCVFVKCWLFLLGSLCVHCSLFLLFFLEHNVKICKLLFFFIFLLFLNLWACNVFGLRLCAVFICKLALMIIVNEKKRLVEWRRVTIVLQLLSPIWCLGNIIWIYLLLSEPFTYLKILFNMIYWLLKLFFLDISQDVFHFKICILLEWLLTR